MSYCETHTESLLDKVHKIIKTYLFPYETGLKKVRLGYPCDGGYVMADMENFDALYSYGCDNKLSFEHHFYQKYKKPCYLYDHTQDDILDIPWYINFKKEGVSHVKSDKLDTLDSHIIQNGHSNSSNLLLQMDVEGCEWKSLPACKKLLNFSQIVVEFHLEDSIVKNRLDDIINCFETLNKNFTCVHIHGNNSLIQPWFCKWIPYAFEVTYVRNDLITKKYKRNSPLPEPGLDYPNFGGKPDLLMDYFVDE
jgi:hypothetical protein